MKKLIILLLCLSIKYTFAGHLAGGDIIYQCTATPNVYSVSFKLYRDCSGIQMCSNCPTSLSPTCNIPVTISGYSGTCNGTNFGNQTLMVAGNASAYDVMQLCNLYKSICNNCGTRTPGTFSPGVEIYTFQGLINLSSIPSSCCLIRIGYGNCCRSGNNTTLLNPNGQNYWVEAVINRCVTPCNNSATYSTKPIIAVCSGQEVAYNLGATDPDGDSLSFAIGTPLNAAATPSVFNPPYSANVPFNYLGAPNPLNYNPNTGDIIFTPLGSFISMLVMEVKEWRNISGLPTVVGITRRDIIIASGVCPSNILPKFKTYNYLNVATSPQPTYNYTLNANNPFCFTAVAFDSSATNDTTYITENIPTELDTSGFTVTRHYNPLTRSTNGPRLDSVKICWTPTVAHVRTKPYYFFLNAKDNFCPVEGKVTKAFSLTVNAPLPVKLISFVGILDEPNTVKLNWQTAQELNNKGFYIERSLDAKNFEETGFAKGVGSTNKTTNYQYFDKVNLNQQVLYYRLKQVDFNGKFEYSNMITIANNSAINVSIFPNPTKGDFTIDFGFNFTGKIEILNAEGKMVLSQNVVNKDKENYNLSGLKGIYLVKIISKNHTQTLKLQLQD